MKRIVECGQCKFEQGQVWCENCDYNLDLDESGENETVDGDRFSNLIWYIIERECG